MPDVIFNEPKISPGERPSLPPSSAISGWLMKNSGGAIKTEKEAEIIITIASVLVLAFSLYFIFAGGGPELPSGVRDVPPQGLPIN